MIFVIVFLFSDDDFDDQDNFVFEEFVRLRVAGLEENNETDA